MRLKTVCAFILFFCCHFIGYAQKSEITYYDARKFYLYGKAFNNQQQYHRADTATYNELPATVKNLLTHSAGLAIVFKTNSKSISAKWCVTDKKPGNNMTLIAQKGLDLYIKRDGKWQFAGVGRPSSNICSEFTLVKAMDNTEKECMIFLPLYDELKSLEIGVEAGSSIVSLNNPFRKRVVIYGSSIVHGASAGRPGMAYPAILSRSTGLYFMNLGISGNAKMEKSAAKMVSDIEADAFILDCVPNPSPQQIKERAEDFVKTVRAKHTKAPIILIQSIFREQGNFDLEVKERVKQQNVEITAAFNRLKSAGVKDLYLITSENLLGDDHDASTDGVHPNDLGFYRMAAQLGPQITKILGQYNIK
ncbi:SGNH/GDSL hydrolase family protein [Pedobacter sp. SL55]|uniref:SGNH/GDSL hydrolase family protein n=1 Tax=Pedobacter sp. SL55 TaxID=2995161 RepID=UPI00226F1295|nr:SGNH/GDSL hydrolase family protein [Pedobacter sp. SL55]WAC39156.1 SGNH/GDSL hydrolase family protein [Pedobacter sp. SL55]